MKSKSVTQYLAKFVRVLTTPPIFAALLSTLLYFLCEGSFASLSHYLSALFFLTGLPLLAYPVAALVPPLRRKGRRAQRNLALAFSVVGYVCGFLFAMLSGGAAVEKIMLGTYVFSGISLAVTTVLHFKASGHTCGCSGPIAMLSFFVSPWFLLSYILLTPIFWSSKRLGRHSGAQLVVGCIIPVLGILLCSLLFLPA